MAKNRKKRNKDEFFISCPRCQEGFLTLQTMLYKTEVNYIMWDGKDKAFVDDAGEQEKEVEHALGCNECPYTKPIEMSVNKILPTIAKWAKEKVKPLIEGKKLSLTERPRKHVEATAEKV